MSTVTNHRFLLAALLASVAVAPLWPAPVHAAPASQTFSDTHVFPGDYDTTGNWSRVLHPGPLAVRAREVATLTSLYDGRTTFPVILYRPNTTESVPVIVAATAKMADNLDPAQLHQGDGIRPLERWLGEQLVDNFVPHGYAVAIVVMRGTGDAGGCTDILGPAERADIDQVATWLGTRNWSSGAVGFIGLSYDGGLALMGAAAGNRHVRTVVPMASVFDLLTYAFPNGTVRNPYSNVGPAHHVSHAVFGSVETIPEHAACPDALVGLEATAAGYVNPERRPHDALGVSLVGDYWIHRDSRPGLEANYSGSLLVLHGLKDWNVEPNMVYPWISRLIDRGLPVKQVLGQWGHKYPDGNSSAEDPFAEVAGDARWDWAEILLHWFDRWLKGDESVDVGAAAQVQDSSGRWRSGPSWPPADGTVQRFLLAPDHALATNPKPCRAWRPLATSPCTVDYLVGPDTDALPEDGSGADDIRDALAPARPADALCTVCAHFSTAPFAQEFRFAGVPRLPLTVLATGPGEIAANLYVVDPQGGVERVGRGQIDLNFADGTDTYKPVPCQARPGGARCEVVRVAMQLQALDVVVPAGSRLRLELSVGTQGAHAPGAPQTPMFVRAGGKESHLEILSYEADCTAFFEPPTRAHPQRVDLCPAAGAAEPAAARAGRGV